MILVTLILGISADTVCDGTETCKVEFNEVCGSDGNTYINECVFNKVKCFRDTNIEWVIVHICQLTNIHQELFAMGPVVPIMNRVNKLTCPQLISAVVTQATAFSGRINVPY